MPSEGKGEQECQGLGFWRPKGRCRQDRDWGPRSSAQCLDHILVPLAWCCRTQ